MLLYFAVPDTPVSVFDDTDIFFESDCGSVIVVFVVDSVNRFYGKNHPDGQTGYGDPFCLICLNPSF